MPAGIPGEVNRIWDSAVEPQVITPYGTTGAPGAYGVPVVIDATSGQVRTLVAADTAVYGFLARPFPTGSSLGGMAANVAGSTLGTSVPPSSGTCDVMVSGYMSVLLGGLAAAVKAAPVYIWTATTITNHVQGTIEAAATVGSTIQVANAYFTGPADSSGNTEIAFRP
jgi:hypothetical protein